MVFCGLPVPRPSACKLTGGCEEICELRAASADDLGEGVFEGLRKIFACDGEPVGGGWLFARAGGSIDPFWPNDLGTSRELRARNEVGRLPPAA